MIRLAEQFERSRDQSVHGVTIASNNGSVTLEPHAGPEMGDASVAIWAARRNADLLASAIDRSVQVADEPS